MDWKKVLFVLKKEFPYIFENLKKYCSLNEGVYLILKDKKFKRQNDDDFKIQLDRVFFLTENIIFSLSKEYFRIFKDLINIDGIKVDTSHKSSGSYLNVNGKQINFKYTGTYFDVCTLVHEFIHYLNRLSCIGKSPFIRQCFGETLAISFELISEQLLKEMEVEPHITATEIRSEFEKNMTAYYQDIILNLKEAELANDEIPELINNDEILMAHRIASHFQHLLGYVLANYLIQNFSINEIVKLNDKINDFTSVDDVFSYLKTDLDKLQDYKFLEETAKQKYL